MFILYNMYISLIGFFIIAILTIYIVQKLFNKRRTKKSKRIINNKSNPLIKRKSIQKKKEAGRWAKPIL